MKAHLTRFIYRLLSSHLDGKQACLCYELKQTT